MNLAEKLGDWYPLLKEELALPYMYKLSADILPSIKDGTIQPHPDNIFRAFKLCPPDKVKIVVTGQDPYPGGEADGLAFSSKTGKIPKSLRFIFEELTACGMGKRINPDLSDWAEQGVLLLNTCLTTVKGETLAHSRVGWQKFVHRALYQLNETASQPFVVMAWGKDAQRLIRDTITYKTGRLILEWHHPNAGTYDSTRKFTGCNHFIQANEFLKQKGVQPIQWVPCYECSHLKLSTI
jgi:uracil-DNA glycosylase